MRNLIFLFLLISLPVSQAKADTITFWHFHKNELAVSDHCFDNKTCFHHDLIIKKPELNSGDTFFILFGGCAVPERLTIRMKSADGKNHYSFILNATGRGDFIIEGNKFLKINPGNYSLFLFPDHSDEHQYSGTLVLE